MAAHDPDHTVRCGLIQEDVALSSTSFIVLGLVEASGRATPYELKQMVAASVGNFWTVPHSQLYTEPDRLVRGGFLHREQEEGGLRRKRYALTARGSEGLTRWRAEPSAAELPELRDPALLKLFFGGDPATFAAAQRDAHAEKLAAYEAQAVHDSGAEPRGPWLALRAGIAHEREWVRFWEELAGEST